METTIKTLDLDRWREPDEQRRVTRVNAGEEQYEHVELFGKPALFTNYRIDRDTVPKNFSCYDLRGSDCDPGKPMTIESHVSVNHAGTVLTSEPVAIPKEGFRRLHGKLNFLGGCLTLLEFCKEHGIPLTPEQRKAEQEHAEESQVEWKNQIEVIKNREEFIIGENQHEKDSDQEFEL